MTLRILILAFALVALIPEVRAQRTVLVETDYRLRYPTNFFDANSALVERALSATGFSAAPGNLRYWGTDSAGLKGYHILPAGEATGVPLGGTEGQVLTKLSGGDLDTGWLDLPAISGGNGWSPSFAVVADGERRVLQVASWQGGTGDPPAGDCDYQFRHADHRTAMGGDEGTAGTRPTHGPHPAGAVEGGTVAVIYGKQRQSKTGRC